MYFSTTCPLYVLLISDFGLRCRSEIREQTASCMVQTRARARALAGGSDSSSGNQQLRRSSPRSRSAGKKNRLSKKSDVVFGSAAAGQACASPDVKLSQGARIAESLASFRYLTMLEFLRVQNKQTIQASQVRQKSPIRILQHL